MTLTYFLLRIYYHGIVYNHGGQRVIPDAYLPNTNVTTAFLSTLTNTQGTHPWPILSQLDLLLGLWIWNKYFKKRWSTDGVFLLRGYHCDSYYPVLLSPVLAPTFFQTWSCSLPFTLRTSHRFSWWEQASMGFHKISICLSLCKSQIIWFIAAGLLMAGLGPTKALSYLAQILLAKDYQSLLLPLLSSHPS
jgi:hypothetical protein